MSDAIAPDDSILSERIKSEPESPEEICNLKIQLRELTRENEKNQQALYENRCRLEAALAMQNELAERNASLEGIAEAAAVMEKKIQELKNQIEKYEMYEELHTANEKKYEERLTEIEIELAYQLKQNKELRETIKSEKLASDDHRDISVLEEEKSSMKQEIHNLSENMKILQEELVRINKEHQIHLGELKDIMEAQKNELKLKDEILENTRDELMLCHSELHSLKATPADASAKGNSLFAEVEDRRQTMLKDMSVLRNSYLEMKRTYKAKEAVIRELKVQKAALLRKFEDFTVERIVEHAALIETYKATISEQDRKLKEKLKLEMTQIEMQHPSNDRFSYLQSLLKAKKKEVVELQLQLEDNSLHRLLQAEMKHELARQLRLWRCKAMAMQAQLITMKNRLKAEGIDMESELNQLTDINMDANQTQLDQLLNSTTTPSVSIAMNESDITLAKLIKVPKIEIMQNEKLSENQMTDKSFEAIEKTKLPEPSYNKDTYQIPTITDERSFEFENLLQSSDIGISKFKNTVDLNEIEKLLDSPVKIQGFITIDEKEDRSLRDEKNVSSNESEISEPSPKRNIPTAAVNELHSTIKVGDNSAMSSTINIGDDSDIHSENLMLVENKPKVDNIIGPSKNALSDASNPGAAINVDGESNKENTASISNVTGAILKSALVKSDLKLANERKDKEKKNLRFTEDTVDPQGGLLTRQKPSQKKYPIIFISSKTKK